MDDPVVADISPDDIEPFDKSFVSDAFLNRESDVIYRVTVAGKLPAVFPILLYIGSDPWTVPQNVRELIEPTISGRYIPSFEYYVIIERYIPDELLENIRGILAAATYLEKRRVKSMLSEVIDQMEQKYRQEGRQEGRHVAALRMLHKGYPLEDIIEITELSRDEVQALTDQVAAEKET